VRFTVEAVCISDKREKSKNPVKEIVLVKDFGIRGDAHAGQGHRQVSFLAAEDIEKRKKEGLNLRPGDFAENIITRGLDWTWVKVGGKIFLGETEMEVTQIGKEGPTPPRIYERVGKSIMLERGIFARVIKGGTIHAGDRGHYRIG